MKFIHELSAATTSVGQQTSGAVDAGNGENGAVNELTLVEQAAWPTGAQHSTNVACKRAWDANSPKKSTAKMPKTT